MNATETTVRELAQRDGLTADVFQLGAHIRDDDGWEHNAYSVTLRMDGRQITTPFRQGMGIREQPVAFDVLESLLLDASSSEDDFSEFCASFGLDDDSHQAYRMFRACQRTARKLEAFLGTRFGEYMDEDRS